jgi:hypothetical protein
MAALNLLVLVQQQILVVAAAVLVLLELRAHLSLAVLAALAYSSLSTQHHLTTCLCSKVHLNGLAQQV